MWFPFASLRLPPLMLRRRGSRDQRAARQILTDSRLQRAGEPT